MAAVSVPQQLQLSSGSCLSQGSYSTIDTCHSETVDNGVLREVFDA